MSPVTNLWEDMCEPGEDALFVLIPLVSWTTLVALECIRQNLWRHCHPPYQSWASKLFSGSIDRTFEISEERTICGLLARCSRQRSRKGPCEALCQCSWSRIIAAYRYGLATVLAEEQILITPLLVAGDDPLVVCKDACFSKFVHTLEGFWRRVVVE